jgi:antirestriction protein ArdC
MTSTVLSEPKLNVYEAVTAQIVAAIEAGADICKMPWHAGIMPMAMPVNAATEMPYHGINIVALWAQAVAKRYITGYWASYKQWQKLGAQVRSGERGSVIIFYKELGGDTADPANVDADQPRFVIRSSHVFNAEQVDGWEFPQPKLASQVEKDEQIDAFVRATKADIRHGSSIACYRRRDDYIEMPSPEQFTGTLTSSPTEAYYAVQLHELVHWTGASHRIDRTFGKRFGDRDYAFEELVAELGAAFMCSAFRIVNEPRPDHAAYISNWLDILDRDHKAIFTAASMAQQAVEYLRTLAASDGGHSKL